MTRKYNKVMYNLVSDDCPPIDSHKKMSSKGGRATVKKYGKAHMSEIGKKGAKARYCVTVPFTEEDEKLIK
jgi:hypothetical protein